MRTIQYLHEILKISSPKSIHVTGNEKILDLKIKDIRNRVCLDAQITYAKNLLKIVRIRKTAQGSGLCRAPFRARFHVRDCSIYTNCNVHGETF